MHDPLFNVLSYKCYMIGSHAMCFLSWSIAIINAPDCLLVRPTYFYPQAQKSLLTTFNLVISNIGHLKGYLVQMWYSLGTIVGFYQWL